MNVKTTIMIVTTTGKKEISVIIVHPGLAVHYQSGTVNSWAISHIDSGRQVFGGATSEESALSAALALGKLIDWEVCDVEVVAAMKGKRTEAEAIARKAGMILSHTDPEAPR